jgi:flagellar biosynthesis regulator FlaF
LATPPNRVNAGDRPLTEYTVKNANDRDVEREQLNRILKQLATQSGADDTAAIEALRQLLLQLVGDLQQQINNIPSSDGTSVITIIRDLGSDTTAVTTGTTKAQFRMPCALELMYTRATLATASDAGEVVFDINQDGTSIFGSDKLTVDQDDLSSYTSTTLPDYDTLALSDDALITIDIDSAGTNAEGAKVWLVGRYVVEDLSLSYDFSAGADEGTPASFDPIIAGGLPPFGGFSVVAGALPAGMSVDSDTGVVSGSPSENGTFNFTITMSDSEGTSASYAGELEVNAVVLTYATWNSADKDAQITLTNSDLTFSSSDDTTFASVRATQGKSAGKWYWEVLSNQVLSYAYPGIAQAGFTVTNDWVGNTTTSISGPLNFSSDDCFRNGAAIANVPTTAASIQRYKLDMDAGTLEIASDGGSFVSVATGLTGTWYPAGTSRRSSGQGAVTATANFGASAFTYSVPSGYNAGVYI